MVSLQKPPEQDRPTRVVVRMLVLVVLLAGVGAAIWAAVTDQRIELTETVALDALERGATAEVGDLSINVEAGAGGPVPVVLLHDVDVAGGVVWDAVVNRLGQGHRPLRVDLPGFGLSERIPQPGTPHTVAAMAQVVAEVVDSRFDTPVVMAGVGLGGKVAAEVAVIEPELVSGLVLIDVDFWEGDGWVERLETLPWVGRALVHTLEAGGRLGFDMWAPNCDEGGWCPTAAQDAVRDQAVTVAGTTDSLKAFRETPASSLVPSDLDQIEVPVAFVWSTGGEVSSQSVELTGDRVPGMTVIEAETWDAHLETPEVVVRAVETVSG